ncbi:MAG: sigma-70 family RNA polymerase sigma factor [Solirubrobacterales bacterium]|nr:sigma-70 family RNA polymerase sigma factor [Solirubrobacterales bacterium]
MSKQEPRTTSGTARRTSQRARRWSGPVSSGARGKENLVERLVGEEMPRLLAVARRYSLCADDAFDACQRGMEILIRRADSLAPETADAWLRTVVKHEAMAVRAERLKGVASTEDSLEGIVDIGRVEHSADLMERLRVATEAMGRLKTHEAEALRLRAEGLSYNEIAQLRGWSYTKVNRLVTEGNRAFQQRVAAIESGEQCREVLETLGGAPRGTRLAPDLVSAHLGRCQACRVDAQQIRRRPATLALVLPLLGEGISRVHSSVHAAAVWAGDRSVSAATRAQVWVEAASTGKVVAVAASAAALAGGGTAITTVVSHPPLKSAATGVVHAAPVIDSAVGSGSGAETDGGNTPSSDQPPSGGVVTPPAAEFEPMAAEAPKAPVSRSTRRPLTSPATQPSRQTTNSASVEFGP